MTSYEFVLAAWRSVKGEKGKKVDPALGQPHKLPDGALEFISTRPGRIDKAVELTHMEPADPAVCIATSNTAGRACTIRRCRAYRQGTSSREGDFAVLQIQTANLPLEQQQKVHPDFLANEKAYLSMRDALLPQYRGQWVAVQDGKVIAAGHGLLDVMGSPSDGGHPYFALVGAEDAVVFRVRRAVFAYDQAYLPFPLPRLTATFLNHAETHAQLFRCRPTRMTATIA